VTDRDIVVRNVASGTDPRSTRVMDVMTSAVSYASPEMDITEVTDIMSQKQIRRMPVLENNKLVGILALGDLAVDRRFDTEASEALSEISKNNYRH
jgi:CBS domain-containing protein